MDRRLLLQTASACVLASTLAPRRVFGDEALDGDLPFKISLAEWSLHRTLKDPASKITNLDFPRIAKQEFGIDAVEYVNQFFKDKAKDESYLTELRQRCDDQGVNSLLIMVDGEGALGAAKESERTNAVENHYRWVEAAKFLGCHSIRVNASSSGSYEEQQKLAADGLRRLSEFAKPHGLNVIVENHGGLSSNGAWLSGVIQIVDLDNCGTLPDFGNFHDYDRYKGCEELMPYAKAVSAKMHDFDENGNEIHTDFEKMMSIVLAHGYHGYVGIEYEGKQLGEMEGIQMGKDLLVKVGKKLGKSISTAG